VPIRSRIYASPLWDPYLQRDIDNLERIQRKGARFVLRDFRQRSSITSMLQYLKLEPLSERRTKTRLIIMYRIIKGEIGIPMDTADLQPGRRGRFIQHTHCYQQYKNSFYPRTISDWNLLPSRLKDSATLDSFKNTLPVCYY